MTCETCGEKPKNTAKDFTKAVIEIDNPDETLVLLRKVVVPASMGTEEQVPAAIGKYHNVILYYEANQKSYLYSSDGIPTLLANGITDYEQAVNLPQINGIELIGNKTASDLGLALSSQTVKNLSADDYDYPEYNPVGVALWRLPDGIYHNPRLVGVYTNTVSSFTTSSYFIKVSGSNNATQIYAFDGGGGTIRMYWVNPTTGECQDINKIFLQSTDCVDWLNSTTTNRPLSANQGKVLNERIGDLSTLTTTAKTSAVAAINELGSRVICSLTSAPTTSTAGSVGSLLATVESGTGHLYICTDDTGGTYTWQTLV